MLHVELAIYMLTQVPRTPNRQRTCPENGLLGRGIGVHYNSHILHLLCSHLSPAFCQRIFYILHGVAIYSKMLASVQFWAALLSFSSSFYPPHFSKLTSELKSYFENLISQNIRTEVLADAGFQVTARRYFSFGGGGVRLFGRRQLYIHNFNRNALITHVQASPNRVWVHSLNFFEESEGVLKVCSICYMYGAPMMLHLQLSRMVFVYDITSL